MATRPPRLLSALSPAAHGDLHCVLGDSAVLIHCANARIAESELRSRRYDAVIADPSILATHFHERLLALSVRLAVPLLLWIPRRPEAIAGVLRADTGHGLDVFFRGLPGDELRLLLRIHALHQASAISLTLGRIAGDLARLPLPAALAIMGLLAGAWRPDSVDALAALANAERRTFDRWICNAGFTGAKAFLDAARLLAAFERTLEEPRRVDVLALDAGFGCARSFRRATRKLMGWAPEEFRLQGSPALVADAVATYLTRGMPCAASA